MGLNYNNNHILNRVRTVNSDKNDTITTFDDKIMSINSRISIYNDYISTQKQVILSPETDFATYLLPEDFSRTISVKYSVNWIDLLKWYDYDEFDWKIVLRTSWTLTSWQDIILMYDYNVSWLYQEEIGTYTFWNNVEITILDETKYDIWEYILIKDDVLEIVTKVLSVSTWKINVKISDNIWRNRFITGNVKIKESDFWLIEDYCRYQGSIIKNSDWKKSENWNQWAVSYGVTYDSWNSKDWILSNFYKRLEDHKNSKLKVYKWFTTISLQKV